jgi:hypothetical protein
MSKIVFSGLVNIYMQGPRVLKILDVSPDAIKCDLIGFDDQVKIFDFRSQSLQTISQVMQSGDGSSFTQVFVQPAYAVIELFSSKRFQIMLYDTPKREPEHMLWLAVGLEDNFPVYDYLFCRISPYRDNEFAIIACFYGFPYGRDLVNPQEWFSYSDIVDEELSLLEEVS